MMKSSIYDALDFLVSHSDKYKEPTIYLWLGFKDELKEVDKYKGIDVYYLTALREHSMYIGENCFADAKLRNTI